MASPSLYSEWIADDAGVCQAADDDPYTKCGAGGAEPQLKHALQQQLTSSSSAALLPGTPPAFSASAASPFQSAPRGRDSPDYGCDPDAAAAACVTTPGAAAAAAPFASPDTAFECLEFLQPALEAAGARARLPGAAEAAADPRAALAAAANAAHELVSLLRRADGLRAQQEDALGRLRSEARAAGKAAQQMRGQSEQREQEAAGLKIKLRQLDAWYRSEVDRWGAEREELARRNLALEQRHAQFGHELRRRDAAHEKLQERLRALLRAPPDMKVGASGDTEAGHPPQPATSSGAAAAETQRRAHAPRPSDVSSGAASASGGSANGTPRGAAAARARRSSAGAEGLGGGGGGGGWGAPPPRPGAARPNSGATAARAASLGTQRRRGSTGGCDPVAAPGGGPGGRAEGGPEAAGASAAWQEVKAKLEALQIRAQRVKVAPPGCGCGAGGCGGGCGGGAAAPLGLLAAQASTPHERLLVAKLVEASQIMSEQEQTLQVAIAALAPGAEPGCPRSRE